MTLSKDVSSEASADKTMRTKILPEVVHALQNQLIEEPAGTALKILPIILIIGSTPLVLYYGIYLRYLPSVGWSDLIPASILSMLAGFLFVVFWTWLLVSPSSYWKLFDDFSESQEDEAGDLGRARSGQFSLAFRRYLLPVGISTLLLLVGVLVLDHYGKEFSFAILVLLPILALGLATWTQRKRLPSLEEKMRCFFGLLFATFLTVFCLTFLYLLLKEPGDTYIHSLTNLATAFLLTMLIQAFRLSAINQPIWKFAPLLIVLVTLIASFSNKPFFMSKYVARSLEIGQYHGKLLVDLELGNAFNYAGMNWDCKLPQGPCSKTYLILSDLGAELIVENCDAERFRLPKQRLLTPGPLLVENDPCNNAT